MPLGHLAADFGQLGIDRISLRDQSVAFGASHGVNQRKFATPAKFTLDRVALAVEGE